MNAPDTHLDPPPQLPSQLLSPRAASWVGTVCLTVAAVAAVTALILLIATTGWGWPLGLSVLACVAGTTAMSCSNGVLGTRPAGVLVIAAGIAVTVLAVTALMWALSITPNDETLPIAMAGSGR